MTKISIIMPVYNGAMWLGESITSVIEQTFSDFELICVNDSSTDNSEEILKEFSNKDNRVKYYTKENEGPGMALNFGVEKSNGEYLCFIDQDDKYTPQYLEKMFSLISKTKCSVCQCSAYFWEDDKLTRIPYPVVEYSDNIVNIKTYKQKRLFSGHYFPQWEKIIKKSFWSKNKIVFPNRENKSHDVPVHYMLVGLSDKIGFTDECLYLHRYHENQISYNLDISECYYKSALNVLNWLNLNHINFIRKNNVKSYTKYLIKSAIDASCNFEILDKIERLVRDNYDFANRLSLLRKLKKAKRKIKNTESANEVLNLPKINCTHVGKNSYCAAQPFIANPKETTIGSFVSIGENVRIGHGKHPLNFLSTSPYFYFDNIGWKTDKTPSHNEFWNYEAVNIGNDVWIGDNVLIKNGIKVGDGAVIGMGAVVTKDVPPYAVVAGVPAEIIKYRHSEETIAKLLDLKWWNMDDTLLKKINYDDINLAIEELKKLQHSEI